MEKISIIMPVYNEKLMWVKQSLDSMLNQSYSNIEIIIILDNPENIVLKKFLLKESSRNKKIIVLENKKNLGIVESLNRGLKIATGPFVARMDADDIAYYDRLENEIVFLINNNLDMVISTVTDIDERGNLLLSREQRDLLGEGFEKEIRFKYLGAHSTWLIKKEMFDDLNGYRKLDYVEDLDFLLRGIEKGYALGLFGKPTIKYRVREKSVTSDNRLEMFLNSIEVRKQFCKKRLSLSEPDRIMRKSSQVTESDKIKYSRVTDIRKKIFYKLSNHDLSGFFYIPVFISIIIFNRYAWLLLINDSKRILTKNNNL